MANWTEPNWTSYTTLLWDIVHESKRHERVRFYRQNAFQEHLLILLFLIFIIDIYFYHCFMCLYGCGLSTFIKLPSDLIWSESCNVIMCGRWRGWRWCQCVCRPTCTDQNVPVQSAISDCWRTKVAPHKTCNKTRVLDASSAPTNHRAAQRCRRSAAAAAAGRCHDNIRWRLELPIKARESLRWVSLMLARQQPVRVHSGRAWLTTAERRYGIQSRERPSDSEDSKVWPQFFSIVLSPGLILPYIHSHWRSDQQ